MANDFLSQASFDADTVSLPPDALGHERQARRIIGFARQLPPGAVIALQGTWGRGKTDVLARLAQVTYQPERPPGVVDRAVWINPWQYGTPDLLTPVVLRLQDRARTRGGAALEASKIHGPTVIRAGLGFGAKAGAMLGIPGAPLLEAAAPAAAHAFGALTADDPGDPVAQMGDAFRQLVDAACPPEIRGVGGRVFILVDDLDRCLPERQVALLQALRFLVSAGASATFVVAMDPDLAKEGVRAFYRTDDFDAERYLDKMFDLRVDIPPLSDAMLQALIDGECRRPVLADHGEIALGLKVQDAAGALAVPDLRNPRLVSKVFTKLRFLRAAGALPAVSGEQAVLCLAVFERWPEVRAAMDVASPREIALWADGNSFGTNTDAFLEDLPLSRSLALAASRMSEESEALHRALREVGL